MTQAPPRPTLPLRLVAMRLPDIVDWIRQPSKSASSSDAAANVLQLTPGMVGEIALELENSGSHPITWTLEMMGNFPSAWYCPSSQGETGPSENSPGLDDEAAESSETSPQPNHYQVTGTIQPSSRLYSSIRLNVPKDFFEAQAAVCYQPTLELNYAGEIYLFAQWEGQQRLAGYQVLRIEVRPVSEYIALLPEIFQSEDFMIRFLSIFEQTFDPDLQTLGMLGAYLDPLTAPRAMLPFLSRWVAWTMEPRWTLKQQRRLIRYAIELYRWRGTRRGLRYYLHLYTDLPLDEEMPESEKHISVTDETHNVFVFGQAKIGESLIQEDADAGQPFALGGGKPFHFNVVLRPESPNQVDEPLVRQVIEQVKPAFCTYTLDIKAPLAASSESEVEEPQLQPG